MLKPNDTIGILGSGQLGRMLAMAASRLGLRCHIYAPDAAGSPAAQVSDSFTQAAYDDKEALIRFAKSVDVITYEFENVPAETAAILSAITPVRPGAKALEVSQDRLTEKTALNDLGAPTAGFWNVESVEDIEAGIKALGLPLILKTRRMGYDGKGQTRISAIDQAASAFEEVGNVPSILEVVIPFERELSVIAARGLDGSVACYDLAENVHKNHILYSSTIPANTRRASDAMLLAGKVLNALDYVGVMGIELFETSDGFLVNEIAPRVHNSGHWTSEACTISQFEQHMRAVAGWPIGDGTRHSNAVMINLIGDEVNEWQKIAAKPNTGLHIYGKAESRAGRKMGHYTTTSPKA